MRIIAVLLAMMFILYACSDDNIQTNTGTGTTTVPPAPDNLTSNVPQFKRVQLMWRDNSINEDGFIIERSSDTTVGWSQYVTVFANSTSFLDTGLTPGKTYYYRIYAFNSAGNSGPSNVTSQEIPNLDLNVKIFEDLVLNESTGVSSSLSSLNLLLGNIDSIASTDKDIDLVDFLGNSTDFFFRSGDLSFSDNNPTGFKTQFGQVIEWVSITPTQWDTLSRIWNTIPNSDTLTESSFSNTDTRYPGNEYFYYPLQRNSVFAFYLKGKKDNGITPNPVYGMIWLKEATSAGGLSSFRIKVDVKINIAGRNQFLKILPVN